MYTNVYALYLLSLFTFTFRSSHRNEFVGTQGLSNYLASKGAKVTGAVGWECMGWNMCHQKDIALGMVNGLRRDNVFGSTSIC